MSWDERKLFANRISFEMRSQARGSLLIKKMQILLRDDMRSKQVMQVVREQITRALAMKPSSLDQLKNKLRGLSYSEILRLRQSERMSQDDFQSPPIMSVSRQTSFFF